MKLVPLGDSALLIDFGDSESPASTSGLRAAEAALLNPPLPGVTDVVPAFASIGVHYHPLKIGDPSLFRKEIAARVQKAAERLPPISTRVEVPTCYGGDFGPDLAQVAAHAGLSTEAAAALHCSSEYEVRAIGFLPGFPYLHGLPGPLAAPRHSTPRVRVAAGSVGIGGAQTGIYPFESPGGWQIVGRTPLKLFDPSAAVPTLLQIGDRVVFRPISRGEFEPWKS